MSVENKKTLEAYDKTANIYLANSIEHDRLDMKKARKKQEKLWQFIEESFKNLPVGSDIIEIGSADGVNAKHLKELGYNITASDVAEAFLEALKEQGLNPVKFNVLEDEFKKKYFGVLCWRVFVHFTREDAIKVLGKIYDALEDNGILIFNAINRETRTVDSEWVDFPGEYHMGIDRYYNYYTKEELDEIISHTKYKIEHFHKEGGDEKNKWLVYVLKK
ncbi:MAG: class I SAM-dependent methyltransferase [Bacilli bacterium]|nr:class I SAM-dependent methyltransferase [Bacilli bacterium]